MKTTALRIYHNPRCSSSRTVLKNLQEQGFQPEIYLYLKEGLPLSTLHSLCQKATQSADYFLRHKEPLFAELNLQNASEAEMLHALSEYPILLNRPVLESATYACVARPAQNLADFLSVLLKD